MRKYDAAVLFGGISNENEISVITGTMVCNVLKKGGKIILPLYVSQEGKIYAGEELADIDNFKADGYKRCSTACIADGGVVLFNRRGKPSKRVSVDCAVNCCHGGDGEGGGASGLFFMNNIPFASAGLFESAAFMDKYYTKVVLKSLGVKVAPYVYLRHISGATSAAEQIGFPLIVKPCKLGSSIGVVKCENLTRLHAALAAAFEYDDGAIIEKFYSDRREINCAAYFSCAKCVTSECEEAFSKGDLLSYDDKYAGGGKSVYPADIPQSTAEEIKNTTAYVYKSLNMRGIVRFDYLIADGEVILSEINTVPGSLSYYLLSGGFSDFYRVLDAVIKQAKADFVARRGKRLINTGIINNFTSNACKIK